MNHIGEKNEYAGEIFSKQQETRKLYGFSFYSVRTRHHVVMVETAVILWHFNLPTSTFRPEKIFYWQQKHGGRRSTTKEEESSGGARSWTFIIVHLQWYQLHKKIHLVLDRMATIRVYNPSYNHRSVDLWYCTSWIAATFNKSWRPGGCDLWRFCRLLSLKSFRSPLEVLQKFFRSPSDVLQKSFRSVVQL